MGVHWSKNSGIETVAINAAYLRVLQEVSIMIYLCSLLSRHLTSISGEILRFKKCWDEKKMEVRKVENSSDICYSLLTSLYLSQQVSVLPCASLKKQVWILSGFLNKGNFTVCFYFFFSGRCSLISLIRSEWNDHKTTAMPSCHDTALRFKLVGGRFPNMSPGVKGYLWRTSIYPGSIFLLLNLVLPLTWEISAKCCNKGRSKLSFLNQYKRSFCYFLFPGSFVPPSKLCFELDQPQEEE